MSKDLLVVQGLVKQQHVSDLIIVDSNDVKFLTGYDSDRNFVENWKISSCASAKVCCVDDWKLPPLLAKLRAAIIAGRWTRWTFNHQHSAHSGRYLLPPRLLAYCARLLQGQWIATRLKFKYIIYLYRWKCSVSLSNIYNHVIVISSSGIVPA